MPAEAIAQAQCTLTKLTSFDATLTDRRIMVDAVIDGEPVSAMLDTGVPYNMISRELATKLKLDTVPALGDPTVVGLSKVAEKLSIPSPPPEDNRMLDVTGTAPKDTTQAHTVAFGEIKTENTPFFVMGDSGKVTNGPQVVFGADFLETYDLEFDLAHGKVNIFFPNHCPGQVVYWAHKFAEVPIKIMRNGRIILPVAVNGVETHAFLDTGSEISVVSSLLAKTALNIDPDAAGDERSTLTGLSGARMSYHLHTFDSFDFSGVHFSNTPMGIAQDRVNRILLNAVHDPHGTRYAEAVNAPVTLGMSQLEKVRIYLSFREGMMYITQAYAGLASN
jgi:predicted aspartyl protease